MRDRQVQQRVEPSVVVEVGAGHRFEAGPQLFALGGGQLARGGRARSARLEHLPHGEHVVELGQVGGGGAGRNRQRIGDERSATPPAPPHEKTRVGELADRLAHRVTADLVELGEHPLGGQRLAGGDDAEPDRLGDARDGVFERVAAPHGSVQRPPDRVADGRLSGQASGQPGRQGDRKPDGCLGPGGRADGRSLRRSIHRHAPILPRDLRRLANRAAAAAQSGVT